LSQPGFFQNHNVFKKILVRTIQIASILIKIQSSTE